MPYDLELGRRDLILKTRGLALAGALAPLVGIGPPLGKESKKRNDDPEEEVTPPEDLMREHGVLDRLLLIYEAVLRNFDATAILTRRYSPRVRR